MKRRDFFRISAPLLSTPFVLNSRSVSTFNSMNLFNSLDCDTVRDRFLVIVQLAGANDGLNTIIRPEYEDLYASQRPAVKIAESDLLTSSESAYNEIKFHPSMDKIRELCNRGAVNIIQSVGYPTMSRSHFKATDLWLTGGDGEHPSISEGWMGKYLEHIYAGYDGKPNPFMPDPLGIHLRSKSQSLGFHTESPNLAAINLSSKDANNFYTNLTESSISSQYLSTVGCSDKVQFMTQLDLESQVYGQRINEAFSRGCNSTVDYGNYDLGHQLKTVARLVNGGCRTKIFLTELPGFDTHNDQLNRHAKLLDSLSNSVHNFMADLDALGILDRCLVVTFSEFGRKFIDNGFGTDHGTLAPMLLFGHTDQINAGVVGPKIEVDKLDAQGAPLVTDTNNKDYRDVFSSILKQWLGADDDAVDTAFGIYDNGTSLDFIDNSNNAEGTPGCYVPGQQMDNNPMVSVEMPIVQDDYIMAGIATDAGLSSKEPYQELTACNYVDLKPGFVAACGINLRIYPFDCDPDPNGNNALAVFIPDENTVSADLDKAKYTFVNKEKEKIQLIEKFNDGERVKINIFPNPTSDFINVAFKIREEEKKIRLEVLDISGALAPVYMPEVETGSDEMRMKINISHLPQGQYYIRYVSDKFMEIFKFVKL